MEIAGWKTDADWRALRNQLDSEPTESRWLSAYSDFYQQRIDTRYINPMRAIVTNGSNEGEGFAVVALFCTMIEFLESCEQGKNFRNPKRGAPPLGEHEYSQRTAKDYFTSFLKNRTPFNSLVPVDLVDSFYSDVRCGLLHEARTKEGWLISSEKSPGALIKQENGSVTLFRNELLPCLSIYFTDYKTRLLSNTEGSQEAFIRKFDFLCIP